MDETDPSPKRSQLRTRELQRLAVLVEAEEPAGLAHSPGNRRAMATEAGGAIDIDAAFPHIEELNALVEQDGDMDGEWALS